MPSLSVIWHLHRHSTFSWADFSTPPSFSPLSSFPLFSPLSSLQELSFTAVDVWSYDLLRLRSTSVSGYSLALQSHILLISHVLMEGQAVQFNLTRVIQQVGQISLTACVCQLQLFASSIQNPRCPAVQKCLFAAII